MLRTTTIRRGLLAACSLAMLLAGAASAHVTVNPREATQGGFAKLTFRVPNEGSASTTRLEVQFPDRTPPRERERPSAAGWTAKMVRTKLATPVTHGEQISEAVTTIMWTGRPIKPGEFQEFDVSVGPLPESRPARVQGAAGVLRRRGRAMDRSPRRWRQRAGAPGADPDAQAGGRCGRQPVCGGRRER